MVMNRSIEVWRFTERKPLQIKISFGPVTVLGEESSPSLGKLDLISIIRGRGGGMGSCLPSRKRNLV